MSDERGRYKAKRIRGQKSLPRSRGDGEGDEKRPTAVFPKSVWCSISIFRRGGVLKLTVQFEYGIIFSKNFLSSNTPHPLSPLDFGQIFLPFLASDSNLFLRWIPVRNNTFLFCRTSIFHFFFLRNVRIRLFVTERVYVIGFRTWENTNYWKPSKIRNHPHCTL